MQVKCWIGTTAVTRSNPQSTSQFTIGYTRALLATMEAEDFGPDDPRPGSPVFPLYGVAPCNYRLKQSRIDPHRVLRQIQSSDGHDISCKRPFAGTDPESEAEDEHPGSSSLLTPKSSAREKRRKRLVVEREGKRSSIEKLPSWDILKSGGSTKGHGKAAEAEYDYDGSANEFSEREEDSESDEEDEPTVTRGTTSDKENVSDDLTHKLLTTVLKKLDN